MSPVQVAAIVGSGALAALGVAMLLAARLGAKRRLSIPGVGRLSVVTHALAGICCLAGAHQVAAHAFNMDPKLPPLLVGGVFLIVIVGSVALDALEDDAP